MLNKSPLTFSQIEAALAAGNLEMQRPWGDWVPVRRRAVNERAKDHILVPVYMENEVEGTISTNTAQWGFPGIRIAS